MSVGDQKKDMHCIQPLVTMSANIQQFVGIAIPGPFSNPGISGLRNANPGIQGDWSRDWELVIVFNYLCTFLAYGNRLMFCLSGDIKQLPSFFAWRDRHIVSHLLVCGYGQRRWWIIHYQSTTSKNKVWRTRIQLLWTLEWPLLPSQIRDKFVSCVVYRSMQT